MPGCARPVSLEPHPPPPGLDSRLDLHTDINECVTDLHTCTRDEHCVNTPGSFRCYKALTCEPGYVLTDGECTGERVLRSSPTSAPQGRPHPHPATVSPPTFPYLTFLSLGWRCLEQRGLRLGMGVGTRPAPTWPWPSCHLLASMPVFPLTVPQFPCLHTEMEPHRRLFMFLSLEKSTFRRVLLLFLSILTSISQASFNTRWDSGYRHCYEVTFL